MKPGLLNGWLAPAIIEHPLTDDLDKKVEPIAPSERAVRLSGQVLGHVPHGAAIGLRLIDVRKGMALVGVGYAPHLVGDPETQVISGGVITTLLDIASGIATLMSLDAPEAIATLDLRIDYMRAATPGRDLLARCRVTRRTRTIVFVSGVCFEDSEEDPVAMSVATFMRASNESRALKEPEGAADRFKAPF